LEPYNPLQKLAYTSTILFGVVSAVTGVLLFKPAQLAFSDGYRRRRRWLFIFCLWIIFRRIL
jgi:thiosulfate reductase cytochrome b subunit